MSICLVVKESHDRQSFGMEAMTTLAGTRFALIENGSAGGGLVRGRQSDCLGFVEREIEMKARKQCMRTAVPRVPHAAPL
jgi:hypothetical protein